MQLKITTFCIRLLAIKPQVPPYCCSLVLTSPNSVGKNRAKLYTERSQQRKVAAEHAQVNVQVSVIKICRSISSDMEVI